MDLDSPRSSAAAPSASFTPASRIAELNQIDQSISTLLSAASDAVSILSNTPASETLRQDLRTAESARSAFTAAAEAYFSNLSSIEVRLRRQVYALEEAELIRPGNERDTRRGRTLGGDSELPRVGGGPLDPSWLNARATDKVGASMRQELLAQARDFVERAAQSSQNGQTKTGDSESEGHKDSEDHELG
ncbi:hypothetical protein A1O1_01935 [Capronia coronata CBS 617.96]|uniref:Mediator of RNA polymerase II transcription subunit 11 n=1 Tax=Capronia coronata CBS 617.96 TaxID=1182541 RepID=W9YLV8_9EURO|nr:uncharacterized protein A1O1_01935 [Capronia coronata CBS 617.96]EXJ93543.1 hypothetical protein A1O1_01935 [Capronia coronata CBS 617.96]